jgi:hypothetical protein
MGLAAAPGPRRDLPRRPARCRRLRSDPRLARRGDPVLSSRSRAGVADGPAHGPRPARGRPAEDVGSDHGRATITAKQLAAVLTLRAPPATQLAIRNRAILLLTFASGRRRAQLWSPIPFRRPDMLQLLPGLDRGKTARLPRLPHPKTATTLSEPHSQQDDTERCLLRQDLEREWRRGRR